MKSISQLISLIALIPGIAGATAAETPGDSPVRYLIVLDASASMSNERQIATNAIERLLLGGFNSRIHTGDLVGIWTIGEKLNNNLLAPTMWTIESRPQIAGRTLRALRDVKFAKTANMTEVINAIRESAKQSGSLDVFLVTDGAVPVQGTPFDAEIGRVFQQHGAAMRKAKRPFIVVLSAHNGELAAHAISPGGNRVFIPPAAKPAAIAATDDDVFGIARPSATDTVAQSGTNETSTGSAIVKTNPPKTLSVTEISEILRKQQEEKAKAQAAAAAEAAAKLNANSNAPSAAVPANPAAQVKTNSPVPSGSATAPQRVPIEKEPAAVASTTPNSQTRETVRTSPSEDAQAGDEPVRDATSPTVKARDDGPESVPETATIIPPLIQEAGRKYLMMAGGSFGLAALLCWLLVRRRRSRVYPSLITRSLRERERL
jgi:hypothetical protein